MDRTACVQEIAYTIFCVLRDAGLGDYTNPVSNWKSAEDIFEFWDRGEAGKLPGQWMGKDQYEDYAFYRHIYDKYKKAEV